MPEPPPHAVWFCFQALTFMHLSLVTWFTCVEQLRTDIACFHTSIVWGTGNAEKFHLVWFTFTLHFWKQAKPPGWHHAGTTATHLGRYFVWDGFLLSLCCANLIAFSQEAAQYEQQARQRAVQHVAVYMSRMQQYRNRLRRDCDVLLWLHRCPARPVTSSLWFAGQTVCISHCKWTAPGFSCKWTETHVFRQTRVQMSFRTCPNEADCLRKRTLVHLNQLWCESALSVRKSRFLEILCIKNGLYTFPWDSQFILATAYLQVCFKNQLDRDLYTGKEFILKYHCWSLKH